MAEPEVILYRSPVGWPLTSLSISAVQIEAYLQLAGVAYTVRECSTDAACPTGRLPALEIGSTLVGLGPVACPYPPQEEAAAAGALLGYLREHVVDLDRSLRGAAGGEAVAFRSLVQTELLPALVYSTWCEDAAYKQHVQPLLGARYLFPLNYIIPANQRRAVAHALSTDRDAIYKAATRALDAIAAKLGTTQEFLVGSTPSSIDALLYGCLAFLQSSPCAHPALHRHFLGLRELGAYVTRVGEALSAEPVGARLGGDSGKGWSEWARPGGPTRAEKEATALTASLNRKGKIWLGCTAAIIVAYVVFGGQYFSIGYYDDEDMEDEDDE